MGDGASTGFVGDGTGSVGAEQASTVGVQSQVGAAPMRPKALSTTSKFCARSWPPSSGPVPQLGGLWQPRLTMPEAAWMKPVSAPGLGMPASTQLFSSCL
eukprot:1177817-Prorocentrum_minimum.AAC.2